MWNVRQDSTLMAGPAPADMIFHAFIQSATEQDQDIDVTKRRFGKCDHYCMLIIWIGTCYEELLTWFTDLG